MRTQSYRILQSFILFLLPWFTGCSYIPWPEGFAEVSGPNATRSLNGMGVHRRMWESTGAKILTPQKLSPRLDSIDTIVLVGSSYQPPGSLARDWLEKWLAKKPGRTVIYFGRDFDAGLMYREETLSQVAELQRDRAEIQSASRRATNYVNRNAQIPEDTFCRWFFTRTSAPPKVHSKFSGPWAGELVGLEGVWPTGVLLEPPDTKLKQKIPSWIKGGKSPLVPAKTFISGADGEQALGDKEVQRSIWKADELEDSETWDAEWELAGDATVLLAGSDEAPLVHRIEHEKFPGSKILIVANGAPFLNGSLVKPLHRKVSELLIQDCQPAKRVAMMEYGENGILLSNVAASSETNFGMQVLTVWPLSAISMHAAIFGIIAFAVLLPILGRPQSLRKQSVTDFGLHVEAMGRMMFESRDLMYGLRATQEYFTKVRRETPPDWLSRMTLQETARLSQEVEKKAKTPIQPAPAQANTTSGIGDAPPKPPQDASIPAAVSTEVANTKSETGQPTNASPPDPVS